MEYRFKSYMLHIISCVHIVTIKPKQGSGLLMLRFREPFMTMEEQEFKTAAMEILSELGLSEAQAKAIAQGTVELEKSKIRKTFDNEN